MSAERIRVIIAVIVLALLSTMAFGVAWARPGRARGLSSPRMIGLPPTDVTPYLAPFPDRGPAIVVQAVKARVGPALTWWEAQFRVPPTWANRGRSARAAALAASERSFGGVVVAGSRAALEAGTVRAFVAEDSVHAGYSDNRFETTRIQGVDASGPGDVFLVVEGHQTFFINPSVEAGEPVARWVNGPIVQWQVRARVTGTGRGLLLADVRQRSLPGTPAP